MKILMTGVGGPTPRSFAVALKRYSSYSSIEFIGTDINPLAIGLYQYDLFPRSYIISPAWDKSNYWKNIEDIIKKEKIDYAVILPELEVLAWSERQSMGALPCPSLIPDFVLTKLLVDKARMTETLSIFDMVPPSIEFDREWSNIDDLFDQLGRPFWVRSSVGSSGLGSLKVATVEALDSWMRMNPDIHKFLASKFLPGRNLACKLLYHDGLLIRSACAERVNYIMSKVAPSGITGNTSFGRFINEPDIVSFCIRAMEHLFQSSKAKQHGFFTVDLKEDGAGRPYITEINVRHVAFTQCFAAAGANLAADTIRILGHDPTFDQAYRMYKFEEDKIFLRDVDSLPIVMKERDLVKSI